MKKLHLWVIQNVLAGAGERLREEEHWLLLQRIWVQSQHLPTEQPLPLMIPVGDLTSSSGSLSTRHACGAHSKIQIQRSHIKNENKSYFKRKKNVLGIGSRKSNVDSTFQQMVQVKFSTHFIKYLHRGFLDTDMHDLLSSGSLS